MIDGEKPSHVGIRKFDETSRASRLADMNLAPDSRAEEPHQQVEEMDPDVGDDAA